MNSSAWQVRCCCLSQDGSSGGSLSTLLFADVSRRDAEDSTSLPDPLSEDDTGARASRSHSSRAAASRRNALEVAKASFGRSDEEEENDDEEEGGDEDEEEDEDDKSAGRLTALAARSASAGQKRPRSASAGFVIAKPRRCRSTITLHSDLSHLTRSTGKPLPAPPIESKSIAGRAREWVACGG